LSAAEAACGSIAAQTITEKKTNVTKKANLTFFLITIISSLSHVNVLRLFCFLFDKNLLWEADWMEILNYRTVSAAALQLEGWSQ
jgi:hypothetical protein